MVSVSGNKQQHQDPSWSPLAGNLLPGRLLEEIPVVLTDDNTLRMPIYTEGLL